MIGILEESKQQTLRTAAINVFSLPMYRPPEKVRGHYWLWAFRHDKRQQRDNNRLAIENRALRALAAMFPDVEKEYQRIKKENEKRRFKG